MFGPQVSLCDERHLSASKDPEAATIIKRLMSPDDQLGRHLRATAGKLTQARQAGAARFRLVQKLLAKRGCANRQGGADRKSVGEGKSGSVRDDLGGGGKNNKKRKCEHG